MCCFALIRPYFALNSIERAVDVGGCVRINAVASEGLSTHPYLHQIAINRVHLLVVATVVAYASRAHILGPTF